MKEYICIDIGGTSIKYGMVQEDGTFLTTGEMPTEAMQYGGPGIMEKAKKIVEAYQAEYQPAGICVSTAGMVDCEQGKITYAASLIPDYTGTEIKKTLEKLYGIPCEVENDVNCAGLAEHFAGASRGSRISVCLTIGTGIGGAILIDGKVFHGFSGSGCEVGYMHLPGGEFQDLGASSVLVKKTAEYKNMDPAEINGKYVFEQAKQGDEDCIRAIREMCEVLGMGIANICYVVNPEVVVLGGGIMAQKEYLKDMLRESLDKYLLPSVAQHTRLEFAQNQNQAGMLGAYYNFRSRH
ncbi:ROK family protein [Blautia sp.]|jgi:predicted NBD/HSP70 family sugar kinase|uniref:ROK family protein n=1 Tax=Blautia sp. TaxID=1955243 RepID=UPI002E79F827|nr:ROK family protein [Blautia sp.]MED9881056.1 ROK family protein [Blautia sp.]